MDDATFITAIDEFLSHEFNESPVVLSSELRSRYLRRNVNFGRRILTNVNGIDFQLDILFGLGAETRPPLIALSEPSKYLEWPHIERDGVLCLHNEHDAILIRQPIQVLSHFLQEAKCLINECMTGDLREEFENEASTYWNHLDRGGFKNIYCIFNTEEYESSFIYFWYNEVSLVFSDEPNKLKKWVNNFLASDIDIVTRQTIHIRLERAPTPLSYPKTGSDLFKLIVKHDLDLASSLESILEEHTDQLPVLLSAPTKNGNFIGAVVTDKEKRSEWSKNTGPFNGFRKGKVPKEIIRKKIFSKKNVIVKSVELASRSWVIGRNRGGAPDTLSDTTVAIVGCGSLGGFVAYSLAMSGIDNIVLIDKDSLHTANLSRHVLDSRFLNQAKASSLRKLISQKLPHINSVVSIEKSIEALDSGELAKLSSADLVISTMGNSASELFLNRSLNKLDNPPPILIGWMEAFGCAHHALFLQRGVECFECGLDQYGRPLFQAIQSNNKQGMKIEPACGTAYMPYECITVQNAASLVSEFAIEILTDKENIQNNHRVLIESAYSLKKHQVRTSVSWNNISKAPNSKYLERTWARNPDCKSCNDQ